MERILQTFKEYDMEVLECKKKLVAEELKKTKEFQDKLTEMSKRIDKAIEELKKTNYDSD